MRGGGINFHLGTDGNGYNAIIRPVGGTRNQLKAEHLNLEMCEDGRMRHQLQTRMKGMDVFSFAITTAPKSIKLLAQQYNLNLNAVDYFILHQANKMINDKIRAKLKLDSEKFPCSMTLFGNTSSASIPLTIVTQLKNKIEHKHSKFICCGFGVGLSWGTAAFETNNIIISDLVEI